MVERLFPGAQLHSQQRLTGGVSADVYRLDLTLTTGVSHSIVLRMHGTTHAGHPAALEFELLKALHKAGVAVPDVLLVDECCELLPDPFLVMSFVPGSTHIPTDTIAERIQIMAHTLATIHQIPTTGLPALPKRTAPFPEAFDYWPAGAHWQSQRDALANLPIVEYNGAHTLLHGDYWPENLLWQDGSICAVLDWEDAAVGDPLADVAAACVELRYLFGESAMQQFRSAYAQHHPVDSQRLAQWQIYVAAAAQRFMGDWGLPVARVATMRAAALASIEEAAHTLLS